MLQDVVEDGGCPRLDCCLHSEAAAAAAAAAMAAPHVVSTSAQYRCSPDRDPYSFSRATWSAAHLSTASSPEDAMPASTEKHMSRTQCLCCHCSALGPTRFGCNREVFSPADDGEHRQLVQRHTLPCQAQQVIKRRQPGCNAASRCLWHLHATPQHSSCCGCAFSRQGRRLQDCHNGPPHCPCALFWTAAALLH
jgi:hypothetical protein